VLCRPLEELLEKKWRKDMQQLSEYSSTCSMRRRQDWVAEP